MPFRSPLAVSLIVASGCLTFGGCALGGLPGSGPNAATNCSAADLAGTWLLENESTWNELTLDADGQVTAGRHPHGVTSINGALSITADGQIEGWYTVVDTESLQNIPPTPQGTWALTLIGQLDAGKQSMTLDYTLTYTPDGGQAETYHGTWTGTRS